MVGALSRLGHLDRAACRQAVVTYFSFDRMVREHIALYEALLRDDPRPRRTLTGEAA
jgi:hypothetical protein